MGRTRGELLQAAEAELRRVGDVLGERERELSAAEERAEQIEGEPFETQEQAAAIVRRVEMGEQEIERLQQEVAEAEGDVERAFANWEYYSAKVMTMMTQKGTPARR